MKTLHFLQCSSFSQAWGSLVAHPHGAEEEALLILRAFYLPAPVEATALPDRATVLTVQRRKLRHRGGSTLPIVTGLVNSRART